METLIPNELQKLDRSKFLSAVPNEGVFRDPIIVFENKECNPEIKISDPFKQLFEEILKQTYFFRAS